ncbi:Outer membrane efflux protein [Posidoniimonas corsicana]|uniref:Outer membrane efflux protein n=1 Tax=Posidoniimonas corsicana TaxID=1938618 RepID=A0A5C5VH77_9BACT|nr:TolC family protein [Posidoniimonas corsicana]TWT37327.1 Outer membrane efflux protein [Posidoniimonas corsicana]
MHRHTRAFWSLILCGATLAAGCRPTQPFYFMEDGDLSHYLDVATDIEYPDVEEPSLDEVTGALPPLTLKNTDQYEMWDLTLEEATRITLCNSQVMRQIGGAAIVGAQVAQNTPESISRTLVSSVAVTTTYDPALRETTTGSSFASAFSGTGVEAALSEFDAQLDMTTSWQKNDRPQNLGGVAAIFQSPIFQQDLGTSQTQISKLAADGTQFAIRNNSTYNTNSNFIAQTAQPSIWETNFEAFFSRPLLQGAGAQYNRIAGPHTSDQYAANITNAFDGVVLARINTDQTLADFEGGVRNLMRDVEQSYWQLYFTYRDLEARKMGRDSALETWKKVSALYKEGAEGGSADREAQSRAQYFQFKAAVEQGLTDLYRSEARLRYVMGLSMSDGRLIRPADEPTTAQVSFDWSSIHGESQVRRVEIRKQKWEIKKRELELIAARNHLLPRLDAFGTYRWLGAGDNLIGSGNAPAPFANGSNAFNTLTGGDFQEWEVGARFSLPIGFRRQLSTVRHHQLALARDRAILQDLELEISHQLGDSVRDVDLNYQLTQTNFNRRVAAEREVEAVQAVFDAGRITLDLLLDAQRRRAEAESAYYRSLTDYNLSVVEVHYRKGSLLDYNGVYLAEGPWPGKAYFDAMRRARQRDASMYLDYGFTRPNVFSRGPHAQTGADRGSAGGGGVIYEGTPTPAAPVYEGEPVQLPHPAMGAQTEVDDQLRHVNYEAGQAAAPRVLPGVEQAGGATSFPGGYERQADYTTPQAAANAAGW